MLGKPQEDKLFQEDSSSDEGGIFGKKKASPAPHKIVDLLGELNTLKQSNQKVE